MLKILLVIASIIHLIELFKTLNSFNLKAIMVNILFICLITFSGNRLVYFLGIVWACFNMIRISLINLFDLKDLTLEEDK